MARHAASDTGPLAGRLAGLAHLRDHAGFYGTHELVPPQQAQSAAATALASLGALSGLAGAGGNLRTPADQYVALMQSATITDRLIDEFKLMQVYDEKYRSDTREELAKRVRIAIGKKDGLISVEIDYTDPARAALSTAMSRTAQPLRPTGADEAQQRRSFSRPCCKHASCSSSPLRAGVASRQRARAEPKAVAEV